MTLSIVIKAERTVSTTLQAIHDQLIRVISNAPAINGAPSATLKNYLVTQKFNILLFY